MLTGQKNRFAIEAEPQEFVDGWILGRFRFWLQYHEVGNWNDSADLKGCLRWLRDFEQNPRNRYEPRLVNLGADGVFREIYDPVMEGAAAHPNRGLVPLAYSRFHISHLGMSSFEQYDLLLLKDAEGRERCLWRKAGSVEIHDCSFDAGEMERVAREFCDEFEAQYLARG